MATKTRFYYTNLLFTAAAGPGGVDMRTCTLRSYFKVHVSTRLCGRSMHRAHCGLTQARRSPPHHAPDPPAPSQTAEMIVACPPLREIARDCEIRGDTMLQVLATVASSAARSPTVATLDVPATRHGHCGLGRGAVGATGATSQVYSPHGQAVRHLSRFLQHLRLRILQLRHAVLK